MPSQHNKKTIRQPILAVICRRKLNRCLLTILILAIVLRMAASTLTCKEMSSLGFNVGHFRSGCEFDENGETFNVRHMYITPRELYNRVKAGEVMTPSTTSIPRIFHQSYKSTAVAETVVPFIKTWHEGLKKEASESQDPSVPWTFVWWQDEDLDWFMKEFYPEYYKTYDHLPHIIMKADTSRYFIMQQFGGLYADLDIEYTPTNVEETMTQVFEHYIDATKTRAAIFLGCQANALVASTPKATFWTAVHEEWNRRANDLKNLRKVNLITGINMFYSVCETESPMGGDTSPELFIYDFNQGDGDHPGGQIAVHHGTNSWRWSTQKEDLLYSINLGILTIFVVFMLVLIPSILRRKKYTILNQS